MKALVTLVLSGSLAVMAADVSVRERVVYYTVHGTTLSEIQAQLTRLGPKGDGGRSFHGLTEWQLSWTSTFAEEGNRCTVIGLDTELEVTTTLPRWAPERPVDADLVRAWDRYLRALRKHEDGHKRIAMQAAEAVERRVRSLGAYPGCEPLQRAISRLAERIHAVYEAKQAAYDRDTGHGAKQGVVLR